MSISNEEKMIALLQNAVLPATNKEENLQQLALVINDLIVHDFERLIRILYRVDVDENKLKKMLLDCPQADAGILIANLLIERQEQKEYYKKMFSKSNSDIPEEDRWE
ncbi:hypothetical protein OCK74_21215 [Chitinophagaceae bacterium LB-8]|uniref:Uncharacterized protein n=1 Tax=Paraflavisolibacter caeni TaxID=2982496 RepID=A0A9X2XPS2_9BACT|nr:hypothetical protein [Paraflavisolibacter caeni]MCU7551654.1 hypothetical protein [Paraflavisolibacter caeni]